MRNLNRLNLTGLRALEAVGRLGSLAAAAEELAVTVGAVSQQVQKAERQLGRTLFERRPRGLHKTPLGVEVTRRLGVAMAELSAAVALAEADRQGTLTVSVPPVLAEKWLVKRLSRFHRAFPDIRVRLDASLAFVDPGKSDVDICIRFGKGGWPGVRAEKLLDQKVFPLCCPAIAEDLKRPEQIAEYPIIRDPDAMFEWDVWLTPNGLTPDILKEGPDLSNASLCVDGAIAGLGVFLGWEPMATDAIGAGQLVAPFPDRYPTGLSYWLIEAEDGIGSTGARAFKRWLKSEMS
ncbi:LysR substrate-binding domain-containing protein [Nitratireductor sp. XY-223]|uniref:LysR substrate-binding domain-containing protein n=1 Tax=Nitratireductor sp. XY-223 TaxID=2561926 RepID=UPI0010AA4439|nr:LysR substrate-binding domain-containing protein [Nitratireductor sp. XY-223]